MASVQLFSGSWVIEVISNQDFPERFIIEGSIASDGIYPGVTTTPPVSVSGSRWFLRCEFNDSSATGWQPCLLRRTAATYTLQEGLVTVIGTEDEFEPTDQDFNDLVLRCRNLDPQINPRIPLANLPDFTLPNNLRKPGGTGVHAPRHKHAIDRCHNQVFVNTINVYADTINISI